MPANDNSASNIAQLIEKFKTKNAALLTEFDKIKEKIENLKKQAAKDVNNNNQLSKQEEKTLEKAIEAAEDEEEQIVEKLKKAAIQSRKELEFIYIEAAIAEDTPLVQEAYKALTTLAKLASINLIDNIEKKDSIIDRLLFLIPKAINLKIVPSNLNAVIQDQEFIDAFLKNYNANIKHSLQENINALIPVSTLINSYFENIVLLKSAGITLVQLIELPEEIRILLLEHANKVSELMAGIKDRNGTTLLYRLFPADLYQLDPSVLACLLTVETPASRLLQIFSNPKLSYLEKFLKLTPKQQIEFLNNIDAFFDLVLRRNFPLEDIFSLDEKWRQEITENLSKIFRLFRDVPILALDLDKLYTLERDKRLALYQHLDDICFFVNSYKLSFEKFKGFSAGNLNNIYSEETRKKLSKVLNPPAIITEEEIKQRILQYETYQGQIKLLLDKISKDELLKVSSDVLAKLIRNASSLHVLIPEFLSLSQFEQLTPDLQIKVISNADKLHKLFHSLKINHNELKIDHNDFWKISEPLRTHLIEKISSILYSVETGLIKNIHEFFNTVIFKKNNNLSIVALNNLEKIITLSKSFQTELETFLYYLSIFPAFEELIHNVEQAVKLAKQISFNDLNYFTREQFKTILTDVESKESQKIIFEVKLSQHLAAFKSISQQDFPQLSKAIDLLEKLQKGNDQNLVEECRTTLNILYTSAALDNQDDIVINDIVIDDIVIKAHKALIALAELAPINPVDPETQEEISPAEQLAVSTGHKFNMVTFASSHQARAPKYELDEEYDEKYLFNILANQLFSPEDAEHIIAICEKNNIEIKNLKPFTDIDLILSVINRAISLNLVPPEVKYFFHEEKVTKEIVALVEIEGTNELRPGIVPIDVYQINQAAIQFINDFIYEYHSIQGYIKAIITLQKIIKEYPQAVKTLLQAKIHYIDILNLAPELRIFLLTHANEVKSFLDECPSLNPQGLLTEHIEETITNKEDIIELVNNVITGFSIDLTDLYSISDPQKRKAIYSQAKIICTLLENLSLSFDCLDNLTIDELENIYSEDTINKLANFVEITSYDEANTPEEKVRLTMAEFILSAQEAKTLNKIGFSRDELLSKYSPELLNKMVKNSFFLSKLIPQYISINDFLNLETRSHDRIFEKADALLEFIDKDDQTDEENKVSFEKLLELIKFNNTYITRFLNSHRIRYSNNIISQIQKLIEASSSESTQVASDNNNNDNNKEQPIYLENGIKNLAAALGEPVITHQQKEEFIGLLTGLYEKLATKNMALSKLMKSIHYLLDIDYDNLDRYLLFKTLVDQEYNLLRNSIYFSLSSNTTPLKFIAILQRRTMQNILYEKYLPASPYIELPEEKRTFVRNLALVTHKVDELKKFLILEYSLSKNKEDFIEDIFYSTLKQTLYIRDFEIIKMLGTIKIEFDLTLPSVDYSYYILDHVREYDFKLIKELFELNDLIDREPIEFTELLQIIIKNNYQIDFTILDAFTKTEHLKLSREKSGFDATIVKTLFYLTNVENLDIDENVTKFIQAFNIEAQNISDNHTPNSCIDLLNFAFYLKNKGCPRFYQGLINYYSDIVNKAKMDDSNLSQINKICNFIRLHLEISVMTEQNNKISVLPSTPLLLFPEYFDAGFENIKRAKGQGILSKIETTYNDSRKETSNIERMISHSIINNDLIAFSILARNRLFYIIHRNFSFPISAFMTVSPDKLIALLQRKELQYILYHKIITGAQYKEFRISYAKMMNHFDQEKLLSIVINCSQKEALKEILLYEFRKNRIEDFAKKIFFTAIRLAAESRNFEILDVLHEFHYAHFEKRSLQLNIDDYIGYLERGDFKILMSLLVFKYPDHFIYPNLFYRFNYLLDFVQYNEYQINCSNLRDKIKTRLINDDDPNGMFIVQLVNLANFELFDTPSNVRLFVKYYANLSNENPYDIETLKEYENLRNFASFLASIGCNSFQHALSNYLEKQKAKQQAIHSLILKESGLKELPEELQKFIDRDPDLIKTFIDHFHANNESISNTKVNELIQFFSFIEEIETLKKSNIKFYELTEIQQQELFKYRKEYISLVNDAGVSLNELMALDNALRLELLKNYSAVKELISSGIPFKEILNLSPSTRQLFLKNKEAILRLHEARISYTALLKLDTNPVTEVPRNLTETSALEQTLYYADDLIEILPTIGKISENNALEEEQLTVVGFNIFLTLKPYQQIEILQNTRNFKFLLERVSNNEDRDLFLNISFAYIFALKPIQLKELLKNWNKIFHLVHNFNLQTEKMDVILEKLLEFSPEQREALYKNYFEISRVWKKIAIPFDALKRMTPDELENIYSESAQNKLFSFIKINENENINDRKEKFRSDMVDLILMEATEGQEEQNVVLNQSVRSDLITKAEIPKNKLSSLPPHLLFNIVNHASALANFVPKYLSFEDFLALDSTFQLQLLKWSLYIKELIDFKVLSSFKELKELEPSTRDMLIHYSRNFVEFKKAEINFTELLKIEDYLLKDILVNYRYIILLLQPSTKIVLNDLLDIKEPLRTEIIANIDRVQILITELGFFLSDILKQPKTFRALLFRNAGLFTRFGIHKKTSTTEFVGIGERKLKIIFEQPNNLAFRDLMKKITFEQLKRHITCKELGIVLDDISSTKAQNIIDDVKKRSPIDNAIIELEQTNSDSGFVIYFKLVIYQMIDKLKNSEKVEDDVGYVADIINALTSLYLKAREKNETEIIEAAHKALLAFLDLAPINDDTVISPMSNRVVVSTGYQLDIDEILQYHNNRDPEFDGETENSKYLANPITKEIFSPEDLAQIQQVARENRLEISNLADLEKIVLPQESIKQADNNLQTPTQITATDIAELNINENNVTQDLVSKAVNILVDSFKQAIPDTSLTTDTVEENQSPSPVSNSISSIESPEISIPESAEKTTVELQSTALNNNNNNNNDELVQEEPEEILESAALPSVTISVLPSDDLPDQSIESSIEKDTQNTLQIPTPEMLDTTNTSASESVTENFEQNISDNNNNNNNNNIIQSVPGLKFFQPAKQMEMVTPAEFSRLIKLILLNESQIQFVNLVDEINIIKQDTKSMDAKDIKILTLLNNVDALNTEENITLFIKAFTEKAQNILVGSFYACVTLLNFACYLQKQGCSSFYENLLKTDFPEMLDAQYPDKEDAKWSAIEKVESFIKIYPICKEYESIQKAIIAYADSTIEKLGKNSEQQDATLSELKERLEKIVTNSNNPDVLESNVDAMYYLWGEINTLLSEYPDLPTELTLISDFIELAALNGQFINPDWYNAPSNENSNAITNTNL